MILAFAAFAAGMGFGCSILVARRIISSFEVNSWNATLD